MFERRGREHRVNNNLTKHIGGRRWNGFVIRVFTQSTHVCFDVSRRIVSACKFVITVFVVKLFQRHLAVVVLIFADTRL